MYRGIMSLYVLLTTPIPVPWGYMAKAAMMLLAYAALYPYEVFLAGCGVTAIQMAIIVGILTTIAQNMPVLVAEIARDSKRYPPILALYIAICGAIIFSPDIAWIQHGISIFWASYGVFFGLIAVFSRGMLQEFNWGARDWPIGQGNAARWNILRFLAIAVANEALIAHTSPNEWIIGYAFMPILFHGLYWWTVIATHPYE